MCPRSREQGNIRIAKAPCRTHGSADTALLRSACAGWLADAPTSCSARLHCQCRTHGKLRSLVRTVERSAPAVKCARGAWNRGSFCILDVRGGRSARGVLRHYACGKPRQHMRATNGRIQARTGERGAPAVQCACGAWSRGSFCILDVRGGAVSARSAVPLRVW